MKAAEWFRTQKWDRKGEALSSTRIYLESASASFPLDLAQQEPKWYAIHTRSRFEKRVVDLLQEKKVFTFLPLLQQMRRWSDRWSKVEVPAFTCYAFVRIVATAEMRAKVVRTPGVLGLVGREGLGTSIANEEIDNLQTVFKERIPCIVHPFVNVGRRVRIRGGSLDGIEGILVGQRQDMSIVVSVGLLGRSLSIRAEGYNVEPIWSGPFKKVDPSISSKQEILRAS
jgi:transcription antitermination factor NusG